MSIELIVQDPSGGLWKVAKSGFDRGVYGGGYSSSYVNVIGYVTIVTTGNSTDFGDLTASREQLAAFSSMSRGLFQYGNLIYNNIDYVTMMTTGNASDFGDTNIISVWPAGLSSSTRGIFAGGYDTSYANSFNNIQYVSIASGSNMADFGDLTTVRGTGTAGMSSGTRGVFAGGADCNSGSFTCSNVIDYITIASTGDATDFGDLTAARRNMSGCSSNTRGIIFGGYDGSNYLNVIEYITIATTGNSSDFGDLLTTKSSNFSFSSLVRGVVCGGSTGTIIDPPLNNIEYVTIATTGNSVDFGDLLATTRSGAGCSNAHGGLFT